MLPKTWRWIGESSCHWSVVDATPEATVPRATRTPRATTSWLGLTRRLVVDSAVDSAVLSAVLTAANLLAPPIPVGTRRCCAGRRLAVCAGVQLADAAGQGLQDLVGEGGHLVEDAVELAGPQ